MMDMSPNELLEAIKSLGLGSSLTEIEKKVIELRGEKNGKVKRRIRKKKTTTV